MSATLLLQTPKFRIVETEGGNKVAEKYEGDDAMGMPRWRELKVGEADNVSRLFRDWIFLHLSQHPECGGNKENE